LLVNTLSAYEDYYRHRAQLWEIQSISRSRFIAGIPGVGRTFTETMCKLTDFTAPDLPLKAHSADWKHRIHDMRMRIEKERTPAGCDPLAIKTGRGGLMDAEFVAQALCLEQGWYEPNTLAALERGLSHQLIPLGEELVVGYLRLRRVEGVLRRWSYEGETVLPVEPEAFERVSIRCRYVTPECFRAALGECRDWIRNSYAAFFGVPAK
jgi:glutamate-ammonia-ligase adenylyltransferase